MSFQLIKKLKYKKNLDDINSLISVQFRRNFKTKPTKKVQNYELQEKKTYLQKQNLAKRKLRNNNLILIFL